MGIDSFDPKIGQMLEKSGGHFSLVQSLKLPKCAVSNVNIELETAAFQDPPYRLTIHRFTEFAEFVVGNGVGCDKSKLGQGLSNFHLVQPLSKCNIWLSNLIWWFAQRIMEFHGIWGEIFQEMISGCWFMRLILNDFDYLSCSIGFNRNWVDSRVIFSELYIRWYVPNMLRSSIATFENVWSRPTFSQSVMQQAIYKTHSYIPTESNPTES